MTKAEWDKRNPDPKMTNKKTGEVIDRETYANLPASVKAEYDTAANIAKAKADADAKAKADADAKAKTDAAIPPKA